MERELAKFQEQGTTHGAINWGRELGDAKVYSGGFSRLQLIEEADKLPRANNRSVQNSEQPSNAA